MCQTQPIFNFCCQALVSPEHMMIYCTELSTNNPYEMHIIYIFYYKNIYFLYILEEKIA